MINKQPQRPIKNKRKPIQDDRKRMSRQPNVNNNTSSKKTIRGPKKSPTRPPTSHMQQTINTRNNRPNPMSIDPRMRANPSNMQRNQAPMKKATQQRRQHPQQMRPQMGTGQRHPQQRTPQARPRMTKREYLIRKRRKKILCNVLFFIMVLALVSGITIGKVKEYKDTPRAMYSNVSKSIAQKPKTWPSLIIKDEEVVTVESAAGFFKKIKEEGSSVKASDLVCITAKNNELFEQQEEKLIADTQLYLLENKHSNFSYYLDELNRLDKQTYSVMNEFYSGEDKEAAASLLKYKLNNNIQLKTSIFLKQKSDLTKELAQERTFIVSEMNENQQQHVAPVAGIVSYKVDGLEGELVNEKISEISYTEYNRYMKVKANDITQQLSQPLKNTAIFKVIKSNEWTAITYVDKLISTNLEVNKAYPLYAEEIPNKIFDVTLSSIEDTGDGMFKLTLKGNDPEILKYRTLTFTDRIESEFGLEIPASSIIKKDLLKIDENFVNEDENGSFVIVKEKGIVNNHKIDMVCRANGYVYINIKDIPINTELVTLDKSKSFKVTEIEEVSFVLLKGKENQPVRVEPLSSMLGTTTVRMTEEISTKDKVLTNPEYLGN